MSYPFGRRVAFWFERSPVATAVETFAKVARSERKAPTMKVSQ